MPSTIHFSITVPDRDAESALKTAISLFSPNFIDHHLNSLCIVQCGINGQNFRRIAGLTDAGVPDEWQPEGEPKLWTGPWRR